MRIPMTCPCGVRMRVPGDYAGRRIRCKACGTTAVVPKNVRGGVASLGSASALLDVAPPTPPEPGRRIELLADDRTDVLTAEGESSTLLAELGRPTPVPWYELPQLAREAIAAGIVLAVVPRRSTDPAYSTSVIGRPVVGSVGIAGR